MNIELLKKLTRLANNNPNDNEANLAARKVCKMLEEGNWALNNGNSYIPNIAQEPPKTWNDIKRSEETYWRSRPPTGSGRPFEPSQAQRDYYDRFVRKEWQRPTGPFYKESEGKKEEKPKRPLRCTKCGKDIMTAFVGPPQVFVCVTCQWQGYEDGKP